MGYIVKYSCVVIMIHNQGQFVQDVYFSHLLSSIWNFFSSKGYKCVHHPSWILVQVYMFFIPFLQVANYNLGACMTHP
jgi:hypothetical protein